MAPDSCRTPEPPRVSAWAPEILPDRTPVNPPAIEIASAPLVRPMVWAIVMFLSMIRVLWRSSVP